MHALSLRNLTKTYSNGLTAVKGIDLDVEEGDFFALLGPNGAGKTTAIGIITSLVNKTSGSVSVFGHDIDTDLSAAKACLGVVPQEVNVNQWDTVYNCVVNSAGFYGLPIKEARARTEECLRELQL
ncbi:MAG: ABC transporter ATP-binding protein, partial [Fuerstiella sp.]|nr:ABC transporter ATP-binding protein [Fuerstiella sp.]